MSELGVDIGGTKVAVRAAGGRPYEATVRWPANGCSLSEDLDLLREVLSGAVEAAGAPDGLGVALPASLDRRGTVTSWPNRPHWIGLDWAAFVAGALPGVPVRHGDDGDLAALAEADRAGVPDLVYIGVGGGVVLGGRSIPGPDRGSCEVGHMVVDVDGPRCDCGRRGCLQSLASGRAILRRAGRLRGGPTGFDRLRGGWVAREPWAVSAVGDACVAVAAGAVGLAEVMGAGTTVIGGGFAAGLPGFVDAVVEQVDGMARTGHELPRICPSAFDGGSSLHGALLLARRADTDVAPP